MSTLINPIVALSAVPLIPFFLVMVIHYLIVKDKWRALLLAMDITTLFLILAVSGMFKQIFGSGMGFYLVLLFMLICGGLIGGAQNRLKGRVDPKRLFRAVWRISFLLTGLLYLVFFLVGFIPYIWAV